MVTRSRSSRISVWNRRWVGGFQDASGAVISTTLWRRLGGDPAIVGRPITLDGQPYTIPA